MSDSGAIAADASSDAVLKDMRPRQRAREIYFRALLHDKLALTAFIFLAILILATIFAGLIAPHDPERGGLMLRNLPPMTEAEGSRIPYILGTDALGRDQLSRLLHGGRVSLSAGLISVLLS